MRKHRFYRHRECTSVCVEVLKYIEVPSNSMGTRAVVKVAWYRCRSDGRILYPIGVTETFRKKRPEYWRDEWKLMNNREMGGEW